MSYTLVIPATDKGALEAALSDATVKHETGPSVESDEHLAAAKDAVDLLMRTVGRPDDQVVVEVSGHANPAHAPQAGTSDEVLHITVRAIPPVVAVDRSEPDEAPTA